ncbi:hypothetical protein V2J09_020297 [Rumex salicifolius]
MRDSCCHLASETPFTVSLYLSLFLFAFHKFSNPSPSGFVSGTEMVIITWMKDLVWAVISWNLNVCWRFMIWTIGIITLPFRALSALHREKLTAKHFEELQYEIENLLWNYRKLEGQYAMAVKERKEFESLLAELEEEHDKAIAKIEHLEKQLHNLKTENPQLRAIQGKRAWDFDTKDDTKEAQTPSSLTVTEQAQTAPPRTSSIIKATRKDQKEIEKKVRLNPSALVDPNEALLYQKRDIALSQSVFSALISLLVGTAVYGAKEPGIPLILALFVVVGMSLQSIVYILSTVKNKYAYDTIALLSFNWFILGTLTYPTIPVVARFLFPLLLSCINSTLGLLGLGSFASKSNFDQLV